MRWGQNFPNLNKMRGSSKNRVGAKLFVIRQNAALSPAEQ